MNNLTTPPAADSLDFRAAVRAMLVESGWTQGRLAREAGVHPVSVSNFLSGRRGVSLPEKLLPFVYGPRRPAPKNSGEEPS